MAKISAPRLLPVIAALIVMAGHARAVEKEPADKLLAAKYSMAGLRLGMWVDQGEAGPVSGATFHAELTDAGFYTEFFLDYRLIRQLMLEISMGIASRGDAVIVYADDSLFGTINLYPLLVQMKVLPLAGKSRQLNPFLIGGGGVVWGRQNIEIIYSSDLFYDPDAANRTEYDFIGVLGGGVDIALSEQLGLNITAKYHPITFGNTLVGVKEYTGIAVSVGIAYFLHKR